MESKNNHLIIGYILFVVVIFGIIYSTNFIFSNLKADTFYKRAISQEKDALGEEKTDYYRKVFASLAKAIKLNKSNPVYSSTKADLIVQALDDGLGKELSISQDQAEKLYIKSVQLKPTDFEYHLKLGWFYVGRDDEKAEKELIKTVGLYPTGYEIYFHLMKYYIKRKDEESVFKNFLLTTHYCQPNWFPIFKDLARKTKKFKRIAVEYRPKWSVKFIYDLNDEEFNLRDEGFPHLQIPLKFKVYTKEKHDEVFLYKGHVPYLRFEKVEDVEEVSVFELSLDDFPKNVYLDDFKIRSKMYSSLDRVEVIKSFVMPDE